MKRFVAIIDSISDWSGKIFSFLVAASIIVVVVEVVLRYVFNAPTIYSLELTIFMCGITYVMAGAYVHLADAHVRIDLLYARWSPRTKAIVDLIASPLFFLAIGMMVWLGAEWTYAGIVKGATSGSIWNPPIWPIRIFIPIGATLLLLQGIAKFIRDAGIARTRGEAFRAEEEIPAEKEEVL